MRDIFKIAMLSLLLITGLVVISHSIIPHVHHYSTECEIEHQEHHDDSNSIPKHCHFLNDIVFDDVVLTINHIFFDNVPIHLDKLIDAKFPFEVFSSKGTHLLEKCNFTDFLIFFESSPTRGSPF
ncbi:MAG: hypothetical protein DRI84_00535 [Bacteroidetes bacterium]|nr:MAG: hypothetical protein DRI84_00535 [Bacteroidota bacterium]